MNDEEHSEITPDISITGNQDKHGLNGEGNGEIKLPRTTKTVHIGLIHHLSGDNEVLAIAAPFGRFTNFLFMKAKNQALIEFKTHDSALRLIEYSRFRSLLIRGKPISVQFSNHENLKTSQTNKDYGEIYDSFGVQHARRVLHVVIENMLHRATFDDFETLFFRYGEVNKILVFDKNSKTQALVEMSDIESAIMAKISLHEQPMFNDCNIMKVSFSRNSELKFINASSNCKDYTLDGSRSLRSSRSHSRKGSRTRERSPEYYNHSRDSYPSANRSRSYRDEEYESQYGRHTSRQSSIILISNLPRGKLTCDDLYNFVGYYGDIKRIKILYKKEDTALIQMVDGTMARTAIHNLHQVYFDGASLHLNFSNYHTISMPTEGSEFSDLTKDYTNCTHKRYKRPGSKNFRHIYPPSKILHVSNLDVNMTYDDIYHLFTKVARISVETIEYLRNLPSQAFVVTNSITDAIYGIMRLHNYVLPNSSELKVSFSKESSAASLHSFA